MSNTFSLDDLRAEVENEFQPVVITVSDGTEVSLRNLLRLPKKDRDAVMRLVTDLQDLNDTVADENGEAGAEDADRLVDTASQILALVADNGKKLIKELDGDLTLTMRVLEKWMASTSSGKAPQSAS
jgi:hypothetical protein